MNKFKVGDTVVRGAHQRGAFLRAVGPGPHVVTAVSPEGPWLCINNWKGMDGDRYPWSQNNFTLVTEQDDPLPPAPKSGGFKIGDTVRRVDPWGSYMWGLQGGDVGIVSVLHDNDLVEIKGYDGWLHATESLELVEQVDDELPPAPDSVLYFNSIRDRCNDQCITVRPDDDPRYEGTLCISIHPRGDYNEYKSVVLDPDAALQLAHDLRRMAMEIRRKERKEKQHG